MLYIAVKAFSLVRVGKRDYCRTVGTPSLDLAHSTVSDRNKLLIHEAMCNILEMVCEKRHFSQFTESK